MKRQLKDMVTIITGASAGIGRALAVELAGAGGRLVLAARRIEILNELNRELGGGHLCLPTDVGNLDDCRKLIDATMARYGRIDTLVCNAGYGLPRLFHEMSAEEVQKIFQTNWFGTTECCRLAIPIFKKQEPREGFRGQIMIVSSACARRGLPYFSTYAATKAAQLSLAEGLRIELKPQGIAVTSVHPVITDTDFFTSAHARSGVNPAPLAKGSRQTAQAVAGQMRRAIERPKRELWPKPFSRISLDIAVALPGLVDFFMGRIHTDMANGDRERAKS